MSIFTASAAIRSPLYKVPAQAAWLGGNVFSFPYSRVGVADTTSSSISNLDQSGLHVEEGIESFADASSSSAQSCHSSHRLPQQHPLLLSACHSETKASQVYLSGVYGIPSALPSNDDATDRNSARLSVLWLRFMVARWIAVHGHRPQLGTSVSPALSKYLVAK